MEKIIYNVTLADGIRYDLLLRNGQFAAIAKTGKLENSSTAEHMDGTGCLLLPPLVDAHAHLGKTLPMRENPEGKLDWIPVYRQGNLLRDPFLWALWP